MPTNKGSNIAIGIAAGLAGGTVGAWAMTLTQSAMRKAAEASGAPQPPAERSEKNEPKHRGDNPTEKLYERVAGGRRPMTKQEREAGGTTVHLVFGGAAGALYGAASAMDARLAVGRGLPFGAAVWLFGNELGLAAAGLTKSPAEYALGTHAFALASHLVYGVVTDAAIRLAMPARVA